MSPTLDLPLFQIVGKFLPNIFRGELYCCGHLVSLLLGMMTHRNTSLTEHFVPFCYVLINQIIDGFSGRIFGLICSKVVAVLMNPIFGIA